MTAAYDWLAMDWSNRRLRAWAMADGEVVDVRDMPDGDAAFDIRILPGLRQAEPPDVMRGEETKLLGLVADTPDAGGVVVLPGMRGEWVQLARGRAARFHTAMTGQVFDAIAEHILLRHTLGGSGDDECDAGGFAAAVAEGRDAPATLRRHCCGAPSVCAPRRS